MKRPPLFVTALADAHRMAHWRARRYGIRQRVSLYVSIADVQVWRVSDFDA